ncbi:MAG: YfhO family protein [Kiritimatiellae bacterium]|nr:YfhO family protein [Kiritimatiellia bacterium]MDW8457552.1 hypothetical protein [Verrucomicrobiota bacterium]
MSKEQAGSLAWPRRDYWALIAAAIAMGLIVYREAWLPGTVLFTSDDNIGHVAMRQRWLPEGFWRLWDDSILAGQPGFLLINSTNLLLWLLPVGLFHKVIHAFDLAVGTIGFGLFLRARGVRLVPALLGALTAFWLGSTFFLTYAGHIGKFGVVMFAGLAVWLIEEAIRRRSAAWGALAGAACGGMFLEQADLAVFFSIVLGPYALFAAAREFGRSWVLWARTLVPIGIVALLTAGRAIWVATSFYALDGEGSEARTPEEVWDYCTQWSWPPEETIEWIAPGFFGWRSGETAGPYWGRLGRSKEWDTTRQGFMNFKLETLYLGSIPVAFACLGVWLGLQRGHPRRLETIFWLVAVAVTFVLGCGKFTPVYRLFFELPGMSSIRAPVKFMQVTQFAIGVLAAFGLDALLASQAADSRRARRFAFAAAGVAALLLLIGLGMVSSTATSAQRFAQAGWGQFGGVIAENRAWSVLHAGALLAVAAGLCLALSRRSSGRLAWAAVAVVAVDQLIISRHYVKTVPAEGFISRNAVVDLLAERLGSQRVFIAGQDPAYSHWLNILFPYCGIATYNAAQMRMPEDYREYFQAVGNRPDVLWPSFAIGYLLGPAQVWPELESNPSFRGKFSLEYAFNVFPQGGGFRVAAGTEQNRGRHIVARHVAPAPRFALLSGWEALDKRRTLDRMASREYTPLERALVPETVRLPESTGSGISGSVEILRFETGRAELRVASESGGVLRFSEKYTPYWRATINGEPADVFRCDHIFVGVWVPAGIHAVTLEHYPPRLTLHAQAVGFALAALGAVFAARSSRLRRDEA